jgi:type IV pilus biogenesis protein CpaD/CtpE
MYKAQRPCIWDTALALEYSSLSCCLILILILNGSLIRHNLEIICRRMQHRLAQQRVAQQRVAQHRVVSSLE